MTNPELSQNLEALRLYRDHLLSRGSVVPELLTQAIDYEHRDTVDGQEKHLRPMNKLVVTTPEE